MNAEPPLAVDLFCGLGGWAEGFLAEGYRVVGLIPSATITATGATRASWFCRTSHLARVAIPRAACIVASPPCQDIPTARCPGNACESCRRHRTRCSRRASGFNERHRGRGPPRAMVVENVRGAQRWVGRAAWHFGTTISGETSCLDAVRDGPEAAGTELPRVRERAGKQPELQRCGARDAWRQNGGTRQPTRWLQAHAAPDGPAGK